MRLVPLVALVCVCVPPAFKPMMMVVMSFCCESRNLLRKTSQTAWFFRNHKPNQKPVYSSHSAKLRRVLPAIYVSVHSRSPKNVTRKKMKPFRFQSSPVVFECFHHHRIQTQSFTKYRRGANDDDDDDDALSCAKGIFRAGLFGVQNACWRFLLKILCSRLVKVSLFGSCMMVSF